MNISFATEVGAYGRIARGLVRLIYRPCTPERARTLIQTRMAARGDLFLRMAEETIWRQPGSPYRQLLVWAGWSFDRLVESVRRRGLDDTLKALLDAGVYLTFDEFKGRKAIQRDGLTLECTERDFDNPTVLPSFEVRTGGSRSQGSRVPASLDYLAAQRAPARCLTLEALGVGRWSIIIWLPRDASIEWWLALANMGRPALRWFSLTDLSAFRVPQLHQIMFRLAQMIGVTRGLRMPSLEHTPLSEADMVLEAVLAACARHGRCAVVTTPSAATRLAGLAGHLKTSHLTIPLGHVVFVVQGEPLTPGKHTEITRAGARVGGRYGFTEAGSVAEPCMRPTGEDDAHFLADSFGLVCDRRTLPDGRAVDALVLTTLLPSSPKVLLNVESDDFADVTVRRCECPWDELGMHTHLSTIRSFSKLTGEAVMVLGTDCVRILEEVLPREFGGRSIDYQLLEAEDGDHLTRLYLVVSPSVGPIDEARVLGRFIEELRDPRRPRSLMPPLWRQADTIKVVRREPVSTGRGKQFPFHTQAVVLRDMASSGSR